MKNLTIIALTILLAACSNQQDKAEKEQFLLNQHVEKSAQLRGPFCNGEGYRWYYQGKYAISGTCLNGMVFHLPIED